MEYPTRRSALLGIGLAAASVGVGASAATAAPALTLTPAAGPPGSSVTLSGSGFRDPPRAR